MWYRANNPRQRALRRERTRRVGHAREGAGEQPLTSITCIAEAALRFTDLLMTCWCYYKNHATLIELNQLHRLTNIRTISHHKVVSCCSLFMVLCKHRHGGPALQPAAQHTQQGTPMRAPPLSISAQYCTLRMRAAEANRACVRLSLQCYNTILSDAYHLIQTVA